MARSIVPAGFECTAHQVFFQYSNPLSEISLPLTSKRIKRSIENNEVVNEKEEKEKEVKSESVTLPLSPSTSLYLSPSSSLTSYHEICSICLSVYENPVTLVSCHHSFCFHCLFLWLMKKPLCPLCKSSANYFIQTNQYASTSSRSATNCSGADSGHSGGSDDVKVLSISTDTQQFSSTMIHNAIRVHRTRFPSQVKNPEREKKRRRRQREREREGDQEEEFMEQSPNLIVTVSSCEDEEILSREIERVSRDLTEAAERLRALDHIITNTNNHGDDEGTRRQKKKKAPSFETRADNESGG
jgi:hypothetical protein